MAILQPHRWCLTLSAEQFKKHS
jgi:DNA mismatch repair ATPase MutS